MLRLVKQTNKYKESFIAGMKEFCEKESKKDLTPDNFAAFAAKMRDYEKGRNLPKGYVPSSYYWLIDGSEFIGETTIRHKLTKSLREEGGHIGYGIRPAKRRLGYGKRILALALMKAKELGIKKVLLTCDDDNIGSRKIIEVNGGMLEDRTVHNGKMKRRYWIDIK